MQDARQPEPGKQRISRVEVYWTTVSYRTVLVYALLLLAAAVFGWWLVSPQSLENVLNKAARVFGGNSEGVAVPMASQARFVNLDGKVQVKNVDSVQWVDADYRMTLDKGDLIQTGPDSVARLTFADGTTYLVKADTLITVEENTMGQNAPSRVGVHISSGAVDLTTSTWEVPGSKAEVSFENALATLKANSRASVRSDPASKQHEITVAQGGAELERGGERVELAQWEKVSFPTGGELARSRLLAPPRLTQPVNLAPITAEDPKRAAIAFGWEPGTGAVGYRLRVSTTSMFTHVVADKRTTANRVSVTGLPAGDYFWSVSAVDARNRWSEASDTYKFTVFAQGKGETMLLEVERTQLHGNVLEIIGRTEPGATVIILGQAVANIKPDGRFRHFTPPLARGSHRIHITGQNRRGGTADVSIDIAVP